MSARVAWARAFAVAVAVVAIDQLSKRLVDDDIEVGDVHQVLPGLQLVHSYNHGIAFSLSAGGQSVILVLIAVALVAIVGYFARHSRRPLLWLPTGMMVGGALGNLIDRVRDGAVTDFIKLPLWPTFNLADTSITLGVFVLLLLVSGDAHRRTG